MVVCPTLTPLLLPPRPPPPCLPGPPVGRAGTGQGGGGLCGASLARLARAPGFPGVTCESPPATSSALFLFTFPARRQPAALLSAGTPRGAQPAPGTLPHPRRAGVGWETVPLPGRSPPLDLPCSPTPAHPAGGMQRPGRPLRSPSHRIRARTPGTNPLRLCPRFPPAPPQPQAPSRGRLGPRGGLSGRSQPLPTHTYARPAPAERQAGA